MNKRRTLAMTRTTLFIAVVGTVGVFSIARAQAQHPDTTQPAKNADNDEYKIGTNDVLLVTVSDAPEFSAKYRVSEAGFIEARGVRDPIQAEGYSPSELSHLIRQALIDAKQLRDPQVNVFVEEYHGRTITVLGAVSKPGVYALQKHSTVLEAISIAGGAQANAGSTVTIMRGAASAEATNSAEGSVKILDLSRLVKGEDPAANVEVRNGDVVSLSSAQVVYVVGAVTKPGGFVLPSPSEGLSVVQAIAMAEGFKQTASQRHGLIIRQSTSNTARQEIPVDIAEMLSGKAADTLLAPNDILYIPTSGARKTLKVMGDVAMAAVNGVAIYGLGYRIGTRP